jgi:hypothetical protein
MIKTTAFTARVSVSTVLLLSACSGLSQPKQLETPTIHALALQKTEEHLYDHKGCCVAKAIMPEVASAASKPIAPYTMPAIYSLKQTAPVPVSSKYKKSVKAKLLVLSSDGTEANLPAIREAIEMMGVPYDLIKTRQLTGGLSEALLKQADGVGKYQGVITTIADLPYFDGQNWSSSLSAADWNTLNRYKAEYGVRQVNWYTFPNASHGFTGEVTAISTDTAGQESVLSASGRSVFGYLNPTTPIYIKQVYGYLAKPDPLSTPLIVDNSGNALALIKADIDGRETLSFTFDSNQYLTHHAPLTGH